MKRLAALFFTVLSLNSWAVPVFQWAGTNFYETSLNYQVTLNADANNCEFYVDTFFKNYSYYMGWSQYTYQAELILSQDFLSRNTVKTIGAYAVGAHGDAIYLSDSFEHLRAHVKVPENIFQLSYFIDVTPAGQNYVTRLWMSNNGKNFSIKDIFDTVSHYPTVMGNTELIYVGYESSIFNQMKACRF